MKNKEETKRKLITAVAHIFRTEGYRGLGVNKVAKLAGVSKKLMVISIPQHKLLMIILVKYFKCISIICYYF